jgi:hypothetical protein
MGKRQKEVEETPLSGTRIAGDIRAILAGHVVAGEDCALRLQPRVTGEGPGVKLTWKPHRISDEGLDEAGRERLREERTVEVRLPVVIPPGTPEGGYLATLEAIARAIGPRDALLILSKGLQASVKPTLIASAHDPAFRARLGAKAIKASVATMQPEKAALLAELLAAVAAGDGSKAANVAARLAQL